MPYTAILENKINALPQQAFNEVAHYVDYIYTLYVLHHSQPKSDTDSSLQEEKLAVESGYVLLMRYNPVTNLIKMDSKMPDFEKYTQSDLQWTFILWTSICWPYAFSASLKMLVV